MEKKAEIYLGATHFICPRGNEIYAGKIIKDLGDIYVCHVQEFNYFYHISKTGELIVYSTLALAYENHYHDGIWFVSIYDFVTDAIFFFDAEPIEVENVYGVMDAFYHLPYVITRGTRTIEKFVP